MAKFSLPQERWDEIFAENEKVDLAALHEEWLRARPWRRFRHWLRNRRKFDFEKWYG